MAGILSLAETALVAAGATALVWAAVEKATVKTISAIVATGVLRVMARKIAGMDGKGNPRKKTSRIFLFIAAFCCGKSATIAYAVIHIHL
jgi:hypothetical protein